MNNPIALTHDFFFGGRAKFTVESQKTGEWRTYRIGKGKPSPAYPKPAWFVSLLSGPDNENSFTYIGMIDPGTGALTLTRNSRRNDKSPDVVIFRWLMSHVFGDKMLPNAIVHHEGKCGCCGRSLTVPESIKRGIGPECWSRMA